jgi:ABC-2 type transport system permease protein
MIRLIRAEFLKLRTTQVGLWLLLASVAICALIITSSLGGEGGVPNAAELSDVFAATNTASIATFVLGVLGVTTEFRYQTITPTVLATPSRWALITAKLVAYALVGAGYAVVCLAVQLAIAAPWLAATQVDYSLTDPAIRHAMLGVFVCMALNGVIGLGAGALMRNQIVAVTIGLIFLLVLQNIILTIPGVKNAWPYTISGATTAILHTHGPATVNSVHLVGVPVGIIILLLWAFVPAIVGAAFTLNRDIT